jgi:hypothetical protein
LAFYSWISANNRAIAIGIGIRFFDLQLPIAIAMPDTDSDSDSDFGGDFGRMSGHVNQTPIPVFGLVLSPMV